MRKTVVAVVLVLGLAWLVLSYPSTIVAGFIASGQTATPQESDVFDGVQVLRTLAIPCSTSEASAFECQMKTDLVNLNDPAVDAVLVKYKQVIVRNNAQGASVVIFDYHKSNPRQ